MKTVLLSLLASLAFAQSQEQPKIPDAEKVKLQDAKITLLTIENQMAQIQIQFNGLYKQHEVAQSAFDQAATAARKAAKCENCTLTDKLELVRPPEAPKGVVKPLTTPNQMEK